MVDWEQRIEVNPAVLVGKPVVRGTRLAVEFIIDLLAQGWPECEILRNYPGLTAQDIQACLSVAILSSRTDRKGHFSVVEDRRIRMTPLTRR